MHLTHAETAAWYGISDSTAKKGYQELLDYGLATKRDEYIQADYAEDGVTVRRHYSLTGDFSTTAREGPQAPPPPPGEAHARGTRQEGGCAWELVVIPGRPSGAPLAKEVRKLVTPALADWSKTLRLALLLIVAFGCLTVWTVAFVGRVG